MLTDADHPLQAGRGEEIAREGNVHVPPVHVLPTHRLARAAELYDAHRAPLGHCGAGSLGQARDRADPGAGGVSVTRGGAAREAARCASLTRAHAAVPVESIAVYTLSTV